MRLQSLNEWHPSEQQRFCIPLLSSLESLLYQIGVFFWHVHLNKSFRTASRTVTFFLHSTWTFDISPVSLNSNIGQHRFLEIPGSTQEQFPPYDPLISETADRILWPGKVASKAAKASMVSSPRMFLRDRTNVDQQSNVLFHWSPRYGIWWDLGNVFMFFIFWTFQVDQQHILRDDYCTVS